MARVILRIVLVVAVVVMWAGRLPAADGPEGLEKPAPKEEEPAVKETPLEPKSPRGTAKRDPVAEAFVLPHGVSLLPRQEEAFAKLKDDMAPVLRDALEKVRTTEGGEKLRAIKEVKQIREQIRLATLKILRNEFPPAAEGGPAPDASKDQGRWDEQDRKWQEEQRRREAEDRKWQEQQRRWQEEDRRWKEQEKSRTEQERRAREAELKKRQDEHNKRELDRKRWEEEQKKRDAERKKWEQQKKEADRKKAEDAKKDAERKKAEQEKKKGDDDRKKKGDDDKKKKGDDDRKKKQDDDRKKKRDEDLKKKPILRK
jgi:hypothetical protein